MLYIYNTAIGGRQYNLAAAAAVVFGVIIVVISVGSLLFRAGRGGIRVTARHRPRRLRRRSRPAVAREAGRRQRPPRTRRRSFPAPHLRAEAGDGHRGDRAAACSSRSSPSTPIAWIVINSTKTQPNIFESFGFWFARPFEFFRNFSLLFHNVDGDGTYIQWLGNTALYAVLGGAGRDGLLGARRLRVLPLPVPRLEARLLPRHLGPAGPDRRDHLAALPRLREGRGSSTRSGGWSSRAWSARSGCT